MKKATLSLFGLLIPFGWKALPQFFKQTLVVVVLFYAGMLVVGNLHETRIYNELIPLLTAPAVVGLREMIDKAGKE